MRKLVLSIAALLLCLLAHSQGADNLGNSYAEVSIIPRLDISPYYSGEDSELGFTHGNSSLYTLFEGSASEHFSWTIANHWISSVNNYPVDIKDYGWLYRGLGYSNTTNWLDFFKADLTFGNWCVSLGKDVISTLGYECENWDWENQFEILTPFCNALSCYQWGAKVAYTTSSELSTFSAQMVTSPYGERPFSSKLWAYSAQWRGEYGFFAPIWSYSALQVDKGKFEHVIALGSKFSFSDSVNLVIDWTRNIDEGAVAGAGSNCVRGALTYAPSERFDIALHSYLYKFKGDGDLNIFNIGTVAQFYPLRDSRDLRLHGSFTYNSVISSLTLSLGALYNIRIRCW